MQDLSNASLSKVLICCKLDPTSLILLRRTSKRINNQAHSMGLDEMNNVTLNLWSMTCDEIFSRLYRLHRRTCYSISTKLGVTKKCGKTCKSCKKPEKIYGSGREIGAARERPRAAPRYFVRPGPGIFEEVLRNYSAKMNDDEEKRLARQGKPIQLEDGLLITNYAKKTEVLFVKPSSEYFIRKFEESLHRVKTVKILKLSGWRITHEIIFHLTDHPKLRNLHQVEFKSCVMLMEKEEFLNFLDSAPIKNISLGCRFKKFYVDDSCLMNADHINLCGFREQIVPFPYFGITDNLLKQWMIRPPTTVYMDQLTTNFTISGVIELLRAYVATNSSAIYELNTFHLTKKEVGVLLNATRKIKGLHWQIQLIKGYMDITITMKNNPKFVFEFSVAKKLKSISSTTKKRKRRRLAPIW